MKDFIQKTNNSQSVNGNERIRENTRLNNGKNMENQRKNSTFREKNDNIGNVIKNTYAMSNNLNDRISSEPRKAELDSEYLHNNLMKRNKTGQYGVLGVKELDRLYRAVPELDFSGLLMTDSVKGTVGSRGSSIHNNQSNGGDSVNSHLFGSETHSKARSEETRKTSNGSKSSSPGEKSTRSSSVMLSNKSSVSSAEGLLSNHSILSGHTSTIACMALSKSGDVLVSGEQGQPTGKVLSHNYTILATEICRTF